MAQTQVRGARIRRWTFAALAAALIAGCMPNGAGGPSSRSADPPYTKGPITPISGTVTYQRVPADPTSGLLYGSQYFTPAREVVVAIYDADFTLVERGNTDVNGHYSLHAALNKLNQVFVLAELGDPRAPNVAVLDINSGNAADPGDATFGRAVLAAGTTTTPSGPVPAFDIAIQSGISTTGAYAADRPAAPFAILDVIYNERKWIHSADPTVVFPRMAAQWGANYNGGTFYDPSTDWISVDGLVGDDTDEYDTHVIAHEWGHYFVNHFSRDDSLGGTHFFGDILDDSVAWSEGFATGLSGIVTSDLPGVEPLGRYYVDTGWTGGTAGVLVEQDLEGQVAATNAPAALDPGRTQDGYWDEQGISELVYDLWDDTPSEPGDPLALGFTPIYRTMVGHQRVTPWFTSVITFLDGLEAEAPGQIAAIQAEAQRWDIAPAPYTFGAAELETPTTMHRMRRYTSITPDGTVYDHNMDGDPLKVDITDQTNPDYFNKLFARQFIDAQALGSGRYTITITTATPGDEQNLEVMFPGDKMPKFPIGANPFAVTVDTTGGDLIFSVGLQYPLGPLDIPFSVSVEPVAPAAPLGSG